MAENVEKQNFILALLAIIVIFTLFLGLLSFIGYINTLRLSAELANEQIAVLAFESKNSIDESLAGGATLEQYPGYNSITDRLVAKEKAVQRIEVRDLHDKLIFEYKQDNNVETGTAFADAPFKLVESGYTQAETDTSFLLTFPLNNRTQVAGNFHLIISKSVDQGLIFESFTYIWMACGGALLLFSVLLFLLMRNPSFRIKIAIIIIWCVCFAALAGYIMYNMYTLTEEKTDRRLDAIAEAVQQRLQNNLTQNIDAEFLSSASHILNDYKMKNPDIGYLSLTNNDTELIHTDFDQAEAVLSGDEHYNLISKDLTGADEDSDTKPVITVAVRKMLIFEKLYPYAKNLLIILAVSIVLVISFLSLVWAARKRNELMSPSETDRKPRALSRELVFPLLLLVIFCEGLLVSFLPMFFKEVTAQAKLDQIMTPLMFSAYFAGFFISLIPCRIVVQRTKLKALLVAGSVLLTSGYFMMAFFNEYYYLISSRALTGMGQGIILISLITLYNRRSSKQENAKKSNFIYFAFAWGMLAGIVFGALLTTYITIHEIFIIAGAVGALILVYSILFIPKIEKAREQLQAPSDGTHPVKKALRTLIDAEFFKSFFFVGIISKAVITGVIFFALPLFLKDKFNLPDIGQIIIVYFACFLLSSFLISKVITKNKHLRIILFLGTQLAGFGLFALGFMNWEHIGGILPNAFASTIFITASLGLLGLSHGLISIPVLRHITQTKSSALWNKSSLATAYLFLAGLGAIAGPLLFAQMLLLLDVQTLTISWFGVLSILCGIFFICGKFTPYESETEPQAEIMTELESAGLENGRMEAEMEEEPQAIPEADIAGEDQASLEGDLEQNAAENLNHNLFDDLDDNLADNSIDDLEDNIEGGSEDNIADIEEDDKDLL
ncbi:MAG: MFS transporter [Spirochaetales bacterium]|nr:MFS transporter [Spirochaetales bacterium]